MKYALWRLVRFIEHVWALRRNPRAIPWKATLLWLVTGR